MKRRFVLTLVIVGISLTIETSVAVGQAYSSYVAGTQVHASANHWGNSNTTHHLLDTVTIPVAISVSRASWNPGSAASATSLINIYDAGLQCLAGDCGGSDGSKIGKLYTHTGPLLASQTNPQAGVQVSRALVADQNTICTSYPCTLPAGTYSLTSGSSEIAAITMTLWSDGSTRTSGGAEYHIGNSFGNVANEFIAAAVSGVSSTVLGGNTTVTLTTTAVTGQSTAFTSGMTVLVGGLTSGTGGPTDPCNGLHVLTSASPLKYTISGSHSCTFDGNTNNSCGDYPGNNSAAVGCVGAGLPPSLGQLIVDQGNGYYCYQDGSECARSGFVGPAGTQTGAHSVGITIY